MTLRLTAVVLLVLTASAQEIDTLWRDSVSQHKARNWARNWEMATDRYHAQCKQSATHRFTTSC